MKNKSILLALLLISVVSAFATPFRNVKKILVQPDGTELHCFASGDEFYSRLHDADGFTIVQNKNGYFVYATINTEGKLVPTNHIAGKSDPKSIGLKPYAAISQEDYQKRRDYMKVPEARNSHDLNHGVYNNLVVFIKFKGDNDLNTTKTEIDSMFNYDGYYDISMNNYFKKATYNQLSMMSYYYPLPEGNKILAYEDIYPRNYYQPYNETTNPEGYTNQAEREFPLLKRAIESIADQVPDTLNIDRDNDGYIDNVIFVVKGSVGDWSDLLWPHMWSMYGEDAYINGKKVGTFNFQLETSSYFSVSTLCHEMSHSLGLPDLYHYVSGFDHLSPAGPWDLMCGNANPPQHTSTYMKFKYGTWIDEIPEIGHGTYTIEANSWEGGRRNCYKIPTADPNQFYLVEYRNKNNFFEKGLPGSGLLIYRIDTRFHGCADYNGSYEFDEVYIFRPGGTPTRNGSINEAAFSKDVDKTEFNINTDPYPFLNKNQDDMVLNITGISERGNQMTFTYCPVNVEIIPKNLLANVATDSKVVELRWDTVEMATSYNVYRNDSLIANVTENHYEDIYEDVESEYRKYHVTSVCGEESFRSNVESVLVGDYCEYIIDMFTSGDNGWQGGEIKASFDNGMSDRYFTIYSGEQLTETLVLPVGIKMNLSWLSGWDDTECSFSVKNNGETIYESGVLQEGQLTEIITSGERSCVAPKDLTAQVNGSSVVLNWNSMVECNSYRIIRNGEIIADDVDRQSYTDNKITESGCYRYQVLSKNDNCLSDDYASVEAIIMTLDFAKVNIEANNDGNNVVLEWNSPQINGGLFRYDDGNHVTNIGSNSYNCAIMIPSESLGIYENTSLSHIEMFAAANADYTFKFYSGDNPQQQNLIYTETFTVSKTDNFVMLELSEKVPFDTDKNLWITFKASKSDSAPIPCCDYTGSDNGSLIKNGNQWKPASEFNMPYSWLVRAYTIANSGANDNVSYNIFRNDELIASDIKSTNYEDKGVSGDLCYRLEILYNKLSVCVTDDVCLNVSASNDMIFPNPTRDFVNINITDASNVRIYNVLGELILEKSLDSKMSRIDLRQYESGVYVIQVTAKGKVITEKIVLGL